MKVCNTCKIEKHDHEFSKCSSRKDGLQSKCRECSKKYRAENYERFYARDRAYEKENKDAIYKRIKKWRLENPGKANIASKKYTERNREKVLERGRAYRAANKSMLNDKCRQRYYENPEKAAAKSKAYRIANPEVSSALRRARRARKLMAEGSHTSADVLKILNEQRGLCANCQTKLFKSGAKKYHVDHIMPLALGGSNWPGNLQCLCPTCNLSKGAKHPDDWAAQNGRLL